MSLTAAGRPKSMTINEPASQRNLDGLRRTADSLGQGAGATRPRLDPGARNRRPRSAHVRDRIAALVFVAAEAPVDGDRALDLIPTPLRLLLRAMWIVRPGGVRPPPSATRRALCNDLDDATTATVVERIEPEAPGVYRDRVTWTGVPEVPRTYVKCLQDRSDISPARQDEMAKRLRAERVVTLETGHLPMLARPGELAPVLEEVVTQVA
jgi:pimeloyl-ACP methyl ester carboxylesterase